MFHLITHAFFKALLFLSAGSVYHSVHTYEMPVLGGLRSKLPRTSLCMLIGTLAIAGVPFFSGFYSKDAILASALEFVRGDPRQFLLFVLPAMGAVLTAFYMFRMWFLIFDGEPRGYPAADREVVEVEHGRFEADADHGHGDDRAASGAHGHDQGHHGNPVEHAHESPPVMTVPLMILAAFSIFVGYPLTLLPIPGIPVEWTTPVLERAIESAEPLPAFDVSGRSGWRWGASILIAAVGIAGAAGFYSRWRIFNPEAARRGLAPLHVFFTRKWYFDELYDLVFVRPVLALARWIRGFDLGVIDGVVNSSAWITRRLSDAGGLFDRYVVDGAVHAVALVLAGLGLVVRSVQTGQVRTYLALLALAVVGLFVGMFAWVR